MKRKKCTKSCLSGNPYRGYVCTCTACKGKSHGAIRITWKMLEEIVDRKLMDPGLGKAESQRYEALMNTILAHGGRRLRSVA